MSQLPIKNLQPGRVFRQQLYTVHLHPGQTAASPPSRCSCSSSSSVFWHLLGFSAWPESRRSDRTVESGFLREVLSHSRSSLTPTPHRIRSNDHQTGPADTWILPPPPEASGRRGADAAKGPCREPDRHDAGHHGPESVLLQCQADDGEGPGPARALRQTPLLFDC